MILLNTIKKLLLPLPEITLFLAEMHEFHTNIDKFELFKNFINLGVELDEWSVVAFIRRPGGGSFD